MYRFLWGYLKRHWALAVVAMLASLIAALSSTTAVFLIQPIFSEVILAEEGDAPGLGALVGVGESGEEPDEADPISRLELKERLAQGYENAKSRLGIDEARVLYFAPLLFVFFYLLRSLGTFVNGYCFQRIGLTATTEMRNDLYRMMVDQSSRFFARHSSGELVSRVVNDVAVMQAAMSNRLMDVFQQPLVFVLYTWLLISTHRNLALICLVGAPVLIYPIVRFGRSLRKTSHRSQEAMAEVADLLTEGLRGHRIVKAFGMQAFEVKRFGAATRRHLRVNLRAQLLSHLSSPVVESMAVCAAAALLVYAGTIIRRGELEPAEFVGFLVTLMLLYEPIRKLNQVNLVLQQSLAAADRISRLMAATNEIQERPGAQRLDEVGTGIRFRGVSFAYEEERVLSEIDLEIKSGEIVALVGPSGAGKTTLVNLLPRFFDPDEGQVEINGIDVKDVTLESLRNLVGLVSQETVLFNDSIRANIAYGRGDTPLAEVQEAAQAAYAHRFCEEMPKGYETPVGEGGGQLSGGQRQRLAIARALLKNAPILILDEATSHLDSESEALVQKALGNLMTGRTTLVVAHRLSTVKNADRIVVLDKGRIVEQGDHDELLAQGGLYSRLYELQFEM